jgi:hypothetical protein
MELTTLLERLKMDHLLTQLDGVCEQAAQGDVDYKGFLAAALERNGTAAIRRASKAA